MNCQVVGRLFDVLKIMSETESTEINFLEAIYSSEGINAALLSNKMKVTRSAVTQMSNKLEERGLIERYTKPDNKKEKYIKLTKTGLNTLREYEQSHREANIRMCEYLRGLNDEQRDTLIEFLDNLKQCVPISNFECMERRKDA